AQSLLQKGGRCDPQQAEEVSPETVQVLAQKASQANPSIVDSASQFYPQHPALVKGIGAGARALLMSNLSSRTKHWGRGWNLRSDAQGEAESQGHLEGNQA